VCTVAGPPAGTPYPAAFASDIDFSYLPGITCTPIHNNLLRVAVHAAKLLIRFAP